VLSHELVSLLISDNTALVCSAFEFCASNIFR
jgi:hypothetical protein